MPAYAVTIFLGAFLLFQIQPLIAKYILPWFGGGPGVWTTCMLFFQIVLLGGYGYAHVLTRLRNKRRQVLVHLVLLALALALLPVTPSEAWKPTGDANPTLQILTLLAATIGLPYFVLSSTGPLLQQWFSRTNAGASPYRLYALSNVGSLLALVSFPFFFEPRLTRKTQATLWGWGLLTYAVVCGWCALRLWRSRADEIPTEPAQSDSTIQRFNDSTKDPTLPRSHAPTLQRLLWLLLPACASLLLLATTNKITQDIAVVPFLWIIPLGLYLLSFIICFDSPRWYARPPFSVALIAALAIMCWALYKGTDFSIRDQVAAYSLGLFLCCMVCHGELYRLKPEPQHLTEFYLMIAAGGALGGIFVAMIAPLVFTDYFELHWGLVLCGLLVLIVWIREPSVGAFARQEQPPLPLSSTLSPTFSEASSQTLSQPPSPKMAEFPVAPVENQNSKIENASPPPLPLQRGEGRGEGVAIHESNDPSLHHSITPSPHYFARSQRSWRWLAILLTLLFFVGMDRALGALKHFYPAVAKGAINGLRMGLWAFFVLFFSDWIIRRRFKSFTQWKWICCAWLGVAVAALSILLWKHAHGSGTEKVYTSRNFYGVLTLFEHQKDSPLGHHLLLQHGQITHGLQFFDLQEAKWPTTYYGPGSGIHLAMKSLTNGPRRIGIVGLGTGTLASLGRAGDYLRIYDINPEVRRLATSRFTYLRDCSGQVEVVLGDARLSLEREPSQQFDLLALDAFTSDAIPVHLLTREAFAIYERHLKTNGVIVVNISNHYLDLEPVLTEMAHVCNYKLATIDCDEDEEQDDWWLYASTWVALTRSEQIYETLKPHADPPISKKIPLWTDDFASLFQILR